MHTAKIRFITCNQYSDRMLSNLYKDPTQATHIALTCIPTYIAKTEEKQQSSEKKLNEYVYKEDAFTAKKVLGIILLFISLISILGAITGNNDFFEFTKLREFGEWSNLSKGAVSTIVAVVGFAIGVIGAIFLKRKNKDKKPELREAVSKWNKVLSQLKITLAKYQDAGLAEAMIADRKTFAIAFRCLPMPVLKTVLSKLDIHQIMMYLREEPSAFVEVMNALDPEKRTSILENMTEDCFLKFRAYFPQILQDSAVPISKFKFICENLSNNLKTQDLVQVVALRPDLAKRIKSYLSEFHWNKLMSNLDVATQKIVNEKLESRTLRS